jgi:hypothetical protein
MKKLMVIVICLGIAYGAAAQRGHSVGRGFYGGYAARPRISVGFGYYSPFYSPFGYYGYFPYAGYGYYPYGAYGRPSKLQREEADIRSDYADRIYSARHDSSLSHRQKRQTIHSLKEQRDKEIRDLVANYHRQPVNP